jgi:hypothetical protein
MLMNHFDSDCSYCPSGRQEPLCGVKTSSQAVEGGCCLMKLRYAWKVWKGGRVEGGRAER